LEAQQQAKEESDRVLRLLLIGGDPDRQHGDHLHLQSENGKDHVHEAQAVHANHCRFSGPVKKEPVHKRTATATAALAKNIVDCRITLMISCVTSNT